jgi:mono/diheme cytochrome c family protein
MRRGAVLGFECGGILAAAALALALPASAAAQSAPAAQRQVTFTKDVAPILQRSCVTCHRAGESAPMALMTYEDVRPWARSIKTRVSAREMPPWHIDRNIGITKFKDDPSLSDEEIATIVKWVDAGAPRGNPSDMPPLRQFADSSAWQIGTPDIVVKYPAYKVPAAGPDLFGNLYADIPIDSDRYIKAIQTRPANLASRKVVHHALSFAVDAPSQEVNGDDSVNPEGSQFLVEYASGKNAEVYPDDSGVLLQKGKKAQLQYHMHSVGEETSAEVELGIKLYPKGFVPQHIRWSKQLAQPTSPLDIPAGNIARIDGYTVLHKPARIIAFQPHMHIRGKRQCLELIYPTAGPSARTEVINCANFNYNWHLTYNYADDVQPLAPAGTILHMISWHDNSTANKYNPDPKNWVGDGQRTIDEMGFAWIGWYELTDEEYKTMLAERKAQQGRPTQTQGQQQGQQQQQ